MKLIVVVVVAGGAACTAAGGAAEDQTDGQQQEEPQKLDVVLGRPHRSLPLHLQRIDIGQVSSFPFP